MEQVLSIILVHEVVAVILSIVGGLGSYLQRVRNEELQKSIFNFITELVLSIITGLAVLYVGQWQVWEPALINALILILTNNGSETITTAKAYLSSFIRSKFNINGEQKNG